MICFSLNFKSENCFIIIKCFCYTNVVDESEKFEVVDEYVSENEEEQDAPPAKKLKTSKVSLSNFLLSMWNFFAWGLNFKILARS